MTIDNARKAAAALDAAERIIPESTKISLIGRDLYAAVPVASLHETLIAHGWWKRPLEPSQSLSSEWVGKNKGAILVPNSDGSHQYGSAVYSLVEILANDSCRGTFSILCEMFGKEQP